MVKFENFFEKFCERFLGWMVFVAEKHWYSFFHYLR